MSTNNVKAHKASETVGKLNVEDTIALANGYVTDSMVTALDKAEKDVADKRLAEFKAALTLGIALEDAKKTFKANGHGITKESDPYMTWAMDKTRRSKAMIGQYTRLGKNADKLENARSIRHALDILSGKAPEDGSEPEEKDAPVKTDEDYIADMVKALKKINKVADKEAAIATLRKALSEIKANL